MNFINIPITDYYRHCLQAAKNAGFKWMVSLVAYDAEREGLYRNLHRAWLSLDVITGKQVLFVVAGKENRTHDEQWKSRINSLSERSAVYNDHVYFLNEEIELNDYLPDYMRHSVRNERERTFDRVRGNQTRAVEELKEYFDISGRDIPCFIFVSLQNNEKHIVPIRKGANDVFGYFKNLFNQIEPRLWVIRELEVRRAALSQQQREISTTIRSLTFSGDEIIFALYEELHSLAAKTHDAELLRCVTERVYGKFPQPLRSRVNKFVDLVKNYEKNQNKPFDPSAASDTYQEKINTKLRFENKLSEIAEETEGVDSQYEHYLAEIEDIIRRSEMNEKTRESGRLSVTVTGGNPQINAAFDEATITATQNNGVDLDTLNKLLGNVRTAATEMPPEDAEAASENLEVIEHEAQQEKPRKSFLKTALTGLQAIKGTAEFAAAVAALVQFVQTL